jgi:23S rRNA pseudouridine1911/1915/1917 synthase
LLSNAGWMGWQKAGAMAAETKREIRVEPQEAGRRLDRVLAARVPELSRTRIAELISEGRVHSAGRAVKPAHRVAAGERIEIEIAPRPALEAAAEEIPLEILYEDDDLAVVNKPAGMTVHAGAGHARGTLVNALLGRYARLAARGDPLRPGIVHRLDKDTSGAIVIALSERAHRGLEEAFRQRRVEKTYIALVQGAVRGQEGRIELPIARDARRRTRMTARAGRGRGRPARTSWRVLARLEGFTLLAVRLHTGRTHQIRVHFSALGHPVAGDALYGARRHPAAPPRNFLHAARIRFEHPCRAQQIVDVQAPLAPELREWLSALAAARGEDAAALQRASDAAGSGAWK